MKLGRFTAATAAILMAATVFTACSNDDPDTVPLGSGAPLGGPSNPNNTSVEEKSPEDSAEAQAQQALTTFFSVYNKVNTELSANIDDLNNVLGDPALKQYRGDVILRRSKGIQGEGDLKVVSTKVVRNEVPNADESSGKGEANIEIQACVDSSEYKSTRPDGKSDLQPDRLPRQLQQFWVQNDDWPNDAGWLVVGQSLKGNTPCPA